MDVFDKYFSAVKSPISGAITTNFCEFGEVVAHRDALVALSNLYDIWTYFYVPYSMLYKLSVG